MVVLSFCVRNERREQAPALHLGVYHMRLRYRRWVGWGLAPTLSVIGMLGIFLLVAGESLVVLSFCVRDDRRRRYRCLTPAKLSR